MNTHYKFLVAVLAIAAVLSTGCTATRTWDPANKPAANPTESGFVKRIVIFAPVDSSLISVEYPAGSLEFARSMARRTDLITSNVEAWVGETLPNSSSARWDQGALGAASGAHNVVLTKLLNIETTKGIGPNPGRVTATVSMRVLNVNGDQVWGNEFRGFADNVVSAGPPTPAGQPVARATLDACDTAIWGLKRWIDSIGAPGSNRENFDAPVAKQPALIDVTISSIPENADIFVDGLFRGTTPTVVPLPVKTMTVRIERAGYTPWERDVQPSPEMRIQPALLPIGNSVPDTNALPLPSESVEPAVDSDAAAVSAPKPKAPTPVTAPAEESPAPAVVDEEEPVRSSEAGPAPVEELEGVDLPPVE